MGCVLSVWSAVEKTGKTVLSYMLAHKLIEAAKGKPRILLCCANAKNGTLWSLFKSIPPVVEMEDLVNIGAVSDGERINLYSMLYRRGNIYFIGSSRSGPAFIERYADAYRNLIREVKGLFDLVIADVPSSEDNILTKIFLDESDYIINLLPQKPEHLNGRLFKSKKDAAYIVNKYEDSLYGIKELSDIYKLDEIYRLPYCSKLSEFHNRRRLDAYMLQESEFNSAIGYLTEELAVKLGLAKESVSPGVNKSVVSKAGAKKTTVRKSRKVLAALLEGIN